MLITENSLIKCGSMVAVYLSKYPEFPQIGRVQSVSETAINIAWFDGTFNDIWNIVKLRRGKECIEKDNILLLYDIEFTKEQRLKKDTQKALREFVNMEQ